MMKTINKRLAVASLILTGIIVVLSTKAEAAEYCREYNRDIKIGNTIQQAYGTACLQPDGTWKIIDETREAPIAQTYVQERVVYVDKPNYVKPRNTVNLPISLKRVSKKSRYNRYNHYSRYDRGYNRHYSKGYDKHAARGSVLYFR